MTATMHCRGILFFQTLPTSVHRTTVNAVKSTIIKKKPLHIGPFFWNLKPSVMLEHTDFCGIYNLIQIYSKQNKYWIVANYPKTDIIICSMINIKWHVRKPQFSSFG